MAHTSASIKVPVSADKVWQLIGGFHSLPSWLPSISSSELSEGGRIRHLTDIEGKTIVERLRVFNDKKRFYTYSILKSSFPVTDYQATIQVNENMEDDSSLIEWSGSFTPSGISDEESINLFHEMYENGLQALDLYFQNENPELHRINR